MQNPTEEDTAPYDEMTRVFSAVKDHTLIKSKELCLHSKENTRIGGRGSLHVHINDSHFYMKPEWGLEYSFKTHKELKDGQLFSVEGLEDRVNSYNSNEEFVLCCTK